MNFGRAVGKCPCAVFSTQRATTRVAPTEARRHQPCRAGLVPARFACCNHIAKTLTNLEFAVCKVRPLFALTPSPSPTMWERGAARGHVWSAEAAASAWTEAALPHSIIPLARPAGEGDKGGEGKKARLPAHISAGEKSRLPASSAPNRCTLSDLRGVVFTHILRTLAAQLV